MKSTVLADKSFNVIIRVTFLAPYIFLTRPAINTPKINHKNNQSKFSSILRDALIISTVYSLSLNTRRTVVPECPYASHPSWSLTSLSSLVLLTSVLGASSNWMVLRFLHSALINKDAPPLPPDQPPGLERKVVLVSFLRDLTFWKENAKRLGIDLDKLSAKRRFAFVDGLTGLFLPQPQKENSAIEQKVLGCSDLNNMSSEILQAIKQLQSGTSPELGGGGQVLLVIDQLDLLLAAGGDKIDAVSLGEVLMGFREHVHSTVVTLSADYPLVSGHHTPLETDHAAFLLSIAHQANFVISLRLLDTGAARDVSGVIRITVGDQAIDNDQDFQKRVEEKELLYFVGGDGGVKVFERGQ